MRVCLCSGLRARVQKRGVGGCQAQLELEMAVQAVACLVDYRRRVRAGGARLNEAETKDQE